MNEGSVTGDAGPSRRRILVAVLVLGLLAVGFFLARRCGGKEETAPEPSSGEPGETILPPAAGNAAVLVLAIDAEDELGFESMPHFASSPADGVRLVEEDAGPAWVAIDEAVLDAMRDGREAAGLEFDVRSLAEVRVIRIIEFRYRGRGRHGSLRRVRLGSDPGPWPGTNPPSKLLLEPAGGMELYDVLPLPSDPGWSRVGNGFRVADRVLTVGDSTDLGSAETRVRLRVRRHVPIPQDTLPEDPFATEEADAGEVAFRTHVWLRWFGELPVRVEEMGR